MNYSDCETEKVTKSPFNLDLECSKAMGRLNKIIDRESYVAMVLCCPSFPELMSHAPVPTWHENLTKWNKYK